MAEESEDVDEAIVVGIILVSDACCENGTTLGCLVSKDLSRGQSLDVLRSHISKEIHQAPSCFKFLTKQRWPVERRQECALQLKHVLTQGGSVYIKKEYQKPKIGIKAKTGMALGFVFADFDTVLSSMRRKINSELSFFSGIGNSYVFMDGNGWPVSRALEPVSPVLDILADMCVVVCADLPSLGHENGILLSDNMEPPRKRSKALTFRSTRDSDPRFSIDTTDGSESTTAATAKQLLISYVRAEAADHALRLKEQLSSLGYSVYLDVHEIKSGVDWQDSLNDAVSNCEIFVPLVTPRYGETQWTNREVKLADVLGKYILPVNFLSTWPPRCLAIQFATTQYISWKTPAQIQTELASGHGSKVSDIQIWDTRYIQQVAVEIGDRLKQLQQEMMNRVPSLARRKTLMKTFAGKLPDGIISIDESLGEDKSLVVICVHPKQAAFGEEICSLLESDDLTVWCSSSINRSTLEFDSDTLPISQDVFEDYDSTVNTNGCHVSPSNKTFQEYADKASVVIVIVSQAFSRSRTCKQQVFYCEHRKRVIPVKYEDFRMPGWMSMLIGTNTFENLQQKNYQQNLVTRVRRCINTAGPDNLSEEFSEVKMNHAVNHIRGRTGDNFCVYISGGTKFYHHNTEAICRSIATELAQNSDISIATGGFYGIGETLSRAFYEECQKLLRRRTVWHVLPEKDQQDRHDQANQNGDGTFNTVPFGKTIFCGDSVRDRENIVARAFEICVLIEGGPGAAHEAEQFVWNDRIVIPVRCTGGAAGGKFNVPDKIFEIPQGVSESDWKVLSQSEASPKKIGQSVGRIIQSLRQKMTNEDLASSQETPTKPNPKTPSPLKSTSPGQSAKTTLTSMKTVLLG